MDLEEREDYKLAKEFLDNALQAKYDPEFPMKLIEMNKLPQVFGCLVFLISNKFKEKNE